MAAGRTHLMKEERRKIDEALFDHESTVNWMRTRRGVRLATDAALRELVSLTSDGAALSTLLWQLARFAVTELGHGHELLPSNGLVYRTIIRLHKDYVPGESRESSRDGSPDVEVTYRAKIIALAERAITLAEVRGSALCATELKKAIEEDETHFPTSFAAFAAHAERKEMLGIARKKLQELAAAPGA